MVAKTRLSVTFMRTLPVLLMRINECKQTYFHLFLNINQLDALNFIISIFHASTCFEHMCLSSGGQKLYYTVSSIVTLIGGRPVYRYIHYKI